MNTFNGTLRALGEESGAHDDQDLPASGAFEGEDFLFHLYRGSELLQENCVSEAKEELERAFKLRPQDLEGQGLLGVVYFRLGLYPRAIEIYREMVHLCPKEPTPRVNLSLCFLKTGQPHLAREILEQVIAMAPDHRRAWGYLGLAFQQLGDPAKAKASFEHAQQPHMARRMQNLLEGPSSVRPRTPVPEHTAMQEAAGDLVSQLDAAGSDEGAPFFGAAVELSEVQAEPWSTREPGRPNAAHLSFIQTASRATEAESKLAPPSPPPSPPLSPPAAVPVFEEWLKLALISLADPKGVLENARWLALRVQAFALRSDALVALVPESEPLQTAALHRRLRGQNALEHFGAPHAGLTALRGAALLVVRKAQHRWVSVVQLKTLPLYLRESCVLGFDTSLEYENGRFSVGGDDTPMAQLSGDGRVMIESESELSCINVDPRVPVIVRSSELLGWAGRLLVTPLESDESPDGSALFSSLNGEGLALLDVHRS